MDDLETSDAALGTVSINFELTNEAISYLLYAEYEQKRRFRKNRRVRIPLFLVEASTGNLQDYDNISTETRFI